MASSPCQLPLSLQHRAGPSPKVLASVVGQPPPPALSRTGASESKSQHPPAPHKSRRVARPASHSWGATSPRKPDTGLSPPLAPHPSPLPKASPEPCVRLPERRLRINLEPSRIVHDREEQVAHFCILFVPRSRRFHFLHFFSHLRAHPFDRRPVKPD